MKGSKEDVGNFIGLGLDKVECHEMDGRIYGNMGIEIEREGERDIVCER